MTSELIRPPAQLAVTLELARKNLRVDGTYLDDLITMWVEGITEVAQHELGRSLIHQGRRLTLDNFDAALKLDRPPLVSVESVKFYDVDGQLQTLDPADYLVDTAKVPGWVVPAPGRAWPATQGRIGAVIVDYTCGYGPTAASVPKSVALFILAKLAEQYDPATRLERDTVQSAFVDRLLDACSTYS
jgi:uncharacterized phiE125 gp8 family phage protein